MDWNRGKFEYYLDFALVPILCALVASLLSVYVPGIFVGLALWTLAEYWIHRSLFHRVFRRSHWLHHIHPQSYYTLPSWLTCITHAGLLGVPLGLFGVGWGGGLFVGFELGYLSYIVIHDRIHHRALKPFGWLRRKAQHHQLHHQGIEVNFGVTNQFWDRVFGTYLDPRAAGKFMARRFRGT